MNDQNTAPEAEASTEETVYQFDKNEREVVKVRKSTFKGKVYADVRLYVKGQNGAEDIPTKKGVNVPVDLVPELIKGVSKLK
jgi:hypothetical protein